MPFTQDVVGELNMLVQFDLPTQQQGLKVHNTADQKTIAATQRLFEKGLISQLDGGYLTDRGVEAVGHLHATLGILKST